MKFSEMQYERPNIDDIKRQADQIKERFTNAQDFETADTAFIEWDKMSAHVDTMMSLAYTRHSIDTNDEFYEKEVEFTDEISPEFTEIQQSFTKLLVESTFRNELEKKYGSLLFKNAEIFLKE